MKVPVSITINGRRNQRGVEPRLLLVHFIRDLGGITGTKVGCDTSQCGSCTVDVDANFSLERSCAKVVSSPCPCGEALRSGSSGP